MDCKTNPEREEYVIDTVLKPLGIGLGGITRHRELNKPDEKDAADQKSKERNLRIRGLPEKLDKLDKKHIEDRLVQLFKNRLGITDIEHSDIENIYWLGENLIVCFTSKEMRYRVFQRKKRTSSNPDTKNISIHEDLTPSRQKLLYEARNLFRAKKIYASWSECGNIRVQRTKEDRPRTVYNLKQLAEACKK